MIIYERTDSFIMIPQHEHAKISGEFAHNWNDKYFQGIERKEEVVLAVREHDRGWIDLDAAPLWNQEKQKPYSFMDYPLEPKLAYYKKGIDEVEKTSRYAGLLCSLHYVSFLKNEEKPVGKKFVEQEEKRQGLLIKECRITGESEKSLWFQLGLLKFCDNLSLYICLNEPGVKKEDEHPFYRNGIPPVFPFTNNKPIQAQWVNPETVILFENPMVKELQVQLTIKVVTKDEILRKGLGQAYAESPTSQRNVLFR